MLQQASRSIEFRGLILWLCYLAAMATHTSTIAAALRSPDMCHYCLTGAASTWRRSLGGRSPPRSRLAAVAGEMPPVQYRQLTRRVAGAHTWRQYSRGPPRSGAKDVLCTTALGRETGGGVACESGQERSACAGPLLAQFGSTRMTE